MDSVFPFGFPAPTAFYLSLFVATLLLHFVFMSYVFAGTSWVCLGLLRRREAAQSPIVELLKDWMPVMLSGAITAGVGPLPFLQLLYRREFYTANLLLFHRWMLILPVLIVLFYLLYVVKAKVAATRLPWLSRVAAAVAFACVLFVAWSWVENHLLSLAGQDVWSSMYSTGTVTYRTSLVVPRLAMWFALSFPVMSCIVAWQLRWTHRLTNSEAESTGTIRMAAVAMAGLAASALAMMFLYAALGDDQRRVLTSRVALPWFAVAVAGGLVQAAAWAALFRRRASDIRLLLAASAGTLLTLAGVLVCREVLRLAALGDAVDFSAHVQAAAAGGRALFLLFAVLNLGVIVWCLRFVRRQLPG